MKKFLPYILVVLAIIIYASTIGVYSSVEYTDYAAQEQNANQANLPGYHVKSFFSQSEFPFSHDRSGELRVNDFVQSAGERLLSQTFTFRIMHARQISELKFISYQIFHHFHLTNLQFNGFYLFYLCKMLN